MYGLLTRSALTMIVAVGLLFTARAGAVDQCRQKDLGKGVDAMHHARVSAPLKQCMCEILRPEDIGSIKDLVVDMHSGKVLDVALDFGGFLGFGEKLFAVPGMPSRIVKGTNKDEYLVLDVTKDKLKDTCGLATRIIGPTWRMRLGQRT